MSIQGIMISVRMFCRKHTGGDKSIGKESSGRGLEDNEYENKECIFSSKEELKRIVSMTLKDINFLF